MYKFVTVFILNIILSISLCFAQEEWEIERSEKVRFSNTLDSLFLQNEYQQIIDLCNQQHPHYLNTTCTYNLIGAYYFLGDSVNCWKILNSEVDRIKSYPDANAHSLSIILNSGHFTSFKKFLILSSVKSYMLNLIDSFYMTESVTDKRSGLELLHLLIEDQWVRLTSSIYDKLNPERKFPLPIIIDSMQAIQAQREHCTKVFHFYKKHNKVFSKEEVGEICSRQKLLFFHEWDTNRRIFYYKILKQAVDNGVLKLEDQMNFEAANTYIQLGSEKYFKQLEVTQNSLRKKYSKPNYRIQLF